MSRRCIHLLFSLQLVCLCAPSVVIACVQTGSPGSGVTTPARQCGGTQPANSVGLVQWATSAEANYDGLPLGFCSCSSGNAIDYIYPVSAGNNPNNFPAETFYGPGFQCADVTQLCVCDEQGNCYKPYGTLGRGTPTQQIYFPTFCDTGGCHLYTIVQCTVFNDANSGLQNIVTGEQFPCSAQFIGGLLKNIGTNSPYIRAYSMSCHGCVNNPTCGGTFTALPQHAQGR